MKAITAVCATGASVPAIASGRVRHRHREVENGPEIQMYLSKLKDLVPFMAKDRKMSKLEVIQNVIDYICELQNTLAHADASVDASAPVEPRQPLGVRPSAPNTILTSSGITTTTTTTTTNGSNVASGLMSTSTTNSSSSAASETTQAAPSSAVMNDQKEMPSC
ncbi:DNA-binding protein inhibitor ID-3 [Anopheles cruzii]|uniref:DNA-binding protein inhibitor ID-3 n=1 Tax=Anopheles cruzii TaxID=68878 RepID=UPI0022EC989A|nr:DNA-binding protein inhibitor ID-3 [Anopheles cruzii]